MSTGPKVYFANLLPFGNTSMTTGTVAVFDLTEDNDGVPAGTIAFTGLLEKVQPSLNEAACALAANACGAHIHEGTSCDSVETQMGHYFDNPPITNDPWEFERYYSDSNGMGYFGNAIQLGTYNVEGRTFVIHDSQGSRIACGVLQKVESHAANTGASLYTTVTSQLQSSGVTAYVTALNYRGEGDTTTTKTSSNSGVVYFAGRALGLEPNLLGPPNGTDCTSPNGCGIHLHNGTSCSTTTLQGGHLYDQTTLTTDPWALVYYNKTTSDGQTYFAKTVKQGLDSVAGHSFIVHSNDGTRVSCGLMTEFNTGGGGSTASNAASASAASSSINPAVGSTKLRLALFFCFSSLLVSSTSVLF